MKDYEKILNEEYILYVRLNHERSYTRYIKMVDGLLFLNNLQPMKTSREEFINNVFDKYESKVFNEVQKNKILVYSI